MKLAVLNPLFRGASGGVIKHLEQTVPFWLNTPQVESLSIYFPAGIDNLYNLPKDIVYTFPSDDHRHHFRVLSKMVKSENYDAILIATARYVDTGSIPIVVMARNSEPLQKAHYRMPLSWRMRLLCLRNENRKALTHATRIITLSNYMCDLITENFNIDPTKVDTVYHGFDSSESIQTGTPVPGMLSGCLFSAGLLVPYRGTEDLISALAIIKHNTGSCPFLVIAGDYRNAYAAKMMKLARRLRVHDYIHWAGQLSRQEMTWCFRNCAAFIFTSRAESISNIILESMGHGCLSISSDHMPMPEIYGDAAMFYPWGNSKRLAEQIQRVLGMPESERLLWQNKALSRIKSFTWERTATETLDALHKAIQEYS